MKKKKTWMALLLIVMMVVAAACGSEDQSIPTPTPTPSDDSQHQPIVEVTPEPSSDTYAYFGLLTGKPMEEEETSRPVAVLINNLAPARPQSGLTEADIIWEVLAEGGVTRLVAIFQSTSNADVEIGPVRSNRPYFIEIADSYDAIIAHAGASNDAYAILQRQDKPYLDEITNAGGFFWRSSERKAPHNLYTSLTKLREAASKKSYRETATIQGYSYGTEAEAEAVEVGALKQLEVQFQLKSYRVGYSYDAETRLYKRSINDEPHIDKNIDEQLSASNLIFMQTAHKVLDNEGRLSVDLQTGGHAMVIHNGQRIEGSWAREDNGMISFIKDGTPIKLIPGKSIIHVLPLGKEIMEHVNVVE